MSMLTDQLDAANHVDVPFYPYRIFFLYIEPISALLGALYAAQPALYLSLLTLSPASITPLPSVASFSPLQPPSASRADNRDDSTAVTMSLYQLANLYLLFAINEHFVLSSTTSLRTWRRLLMGLLLADFGHLLSMAPLALQSTLASISEHDLVNGAGDSGGSEGWGSVYWRVWQWNAMLWGSVGFVYVGAAMRISFLCGLGLRTHHSFRVQRLSEPGDKDD